MLGFIFDPLLNLGSFWAIVIIAFIVSVMITLIYKFTTDQTKMKALKDELKKGQDEMKKHKKDPDKLMKIQQDVMKTNMQYMRMSMKSTLFTIIPVILVFGWLKASLAFAPLLPNEPFTIDVETQEQIDITLSVMEGQEGLLIQDSTKTTECYEKSGIFGSKTICDANWTLQEEEGLYILEFQTDQEIKQKEVLITTENKYKTPEEIYSSGAIKKITVKHDSIHPMQGIPVLQSIPWIGGFGWLGTYILFSIVFSMSLRKLLKLS